MSLNIDGNPFISDIKTSDNGLLSYIYADRRVRELNYPNYTEKVTYDNMSNITKIEFDNSIDIDFGYDKNNRLLSYDGNGNRVTQNQELNSSKKFNYLANTNILTAINESNGIDTTKISYEYDVTGNIIKNDKHTYKYDARNRLIGVDDNVTYQYNYNNGRVCLFKWNAYCYNNIIKNLYR